MKILTEILSWIGTILGSILLALAIVIFLFQPTVVNGPSMENTLHNEDKIVINKTQNIFHSVPDYEKIVIIDSRVDRERSFKDNIIDPIKYNLITYKFFINQDEFSSDAEIFWVKRVIGRPNDVIKFENNKVFRNGEELKEDYIKEEAYYEDAEIKVPENCVFVMGDNRNNSKDSRVIGCIPLGNVIGTYWFKIG